MNKDIVILGLNFGGHDTSACLMKDGTLIAACEEERYTKQKHTRDFPKNAINDCLKKANLSINDVTEITLSYDPNLLKIENFDSIHSEKRKSFKTLNTSSQPQARSILVGCHRKTTGLNLLFIDSHSSKVGIYEKLENFLKMLKKIRCFFCKDFG